MGQAEQFIPFDQRSPQTYMERRPTEYAVPVGSRCRCPACCSDVRFQMGDPAEFEVELRTPT